MEAKLSSAAVQVLRSARASSSTRQWTRSLETAASSPASSSTSATSSLPPMTSSLRLKPLLSPASSLSAPLPTSTASALSLLKSQSTPEKGLYVVARLHSRNYLLHPKDILTVPNLKSLPPTGSILSLNRILEVGSREYAIKSPSAVRIKAPHGSGTEVLNAERENLGSEVVSCTLTVLEHTKSPMERKLLKKRRKGYKKTIQHKQGWTRLRVGDVILGDGVKSVQEEPVALEELMGGEVEDQGVIEAQEATSQSTQLV